MIQTLRNLERDGLIRQKVYAFVPSKVGYRFSPRGHHRTTIVLSAICLAVSGLIAVCSAQTSSLVENLTSVPSTTIKNGLGFNMDNINNQWEFQMAAAAGSTEARIQPSWSSVENMSAVFAMPTAYETALNWCSTYGIHPLLLAAYGPPYHSLGTFTTAQAYPIGTYTIQLNQSVASINFPYCHVMAPGNTQIVATGKWGYYGGLITATNTTNNTITLASATTVALTAGQTLTINQLLYPSCATASPTDPSIEAYGGYVAFLGSRIAAHGLTGRVELWNEPPWLHDPWEHRGAFYDTVPSGVTTVSPNFGIAENLAPTVAATGVHYNWGGTHKSGGRSVLNPGYMSPALTASDVANSISCESYHPYGNCPEDAMWYPLALATATSSQVFSTGLPGSNAGSNFKQGRWFNLQNPSLGFAQNITETGLYTSDNVRKARFIMREYLGYLADGLERVTFFIFGQPGANSSVTYGFVDTTTQAPTQAYTAIQGLVVTDMGNIPVAPITYTLSSLPTVPSYSGTYPLTTMSIVGRHATTDTQNTIYYVAWQRSHVPPGPVTNLAVTSTTGHVALSWSANSYSVTSLLERATTSGGPYAILASNLTNGTYTDSTVTNGTPYYYVVVGMNPSGTSSNSNEVSASAVATGTGTFNNSSLPAGAAQGSWLALASPPTANVTVQLPSGYAATTAWDLVTRTSVPVTVSGTTATYPVSDDPVSLAVTPGLAVSFASSSNAGLTANGYTASGQTLNVTLNFAPTPGTVLTVINNTSANPITGTFSNLPNGGTINLTYNGTTYAFTANYSGGDGNDLTLTYVPPPSTDTPTMPLWGLAVLFVLLTITAARSFPKSSTNRFP